MAKTLQDTLSPQALATVLAGLRLVQQHLECTAWSRSEVQEILTDGGNFEPLTAEQIDDLCETLNTGGKAKLGHRP